MTICLHLFRNIPSFTSIVYILSNFHHYEETKGEYFEAMALCTFVIIIIILLKMLATVVLLNKNNLIIFCFILVHRARLHSLSQPLSAISSPHQRNGVRRETVRRPLHIAANESLQAFPPSDP